MVYGTVQSTASGTTIRSERPILMALVGPGASYGGVGRIAMRGEKYCGNSYGSGDLANCAWTTDFRSFTLTSGGFSRAGEEIKYILFCE